MNKKALALGLFTITAWGSSFPAIRAALLGGYSPGHLVLLRFAVASSVFILYALWPGTKLRLPAKRDLPLIIVLGWMGITVYHLGITYGEQTISAGTAGLFIATVPIFTTIIAIIFLKERPGAFGWIGMAIGLLGVSLIMAGSADHSLALNSGALLMLLAVISTSFFFVIQKPLFARYTAAELTAYFTWAGTLPFLYFLPGFWSDIQQAPPAATWSIIYMGIVPAAIAYVAWAAALAMENAGSVASLLYAEPVVAILLAWVWLDEWPNGLSIAGGSIAILSIVAVNWAARKRPVRLQQRN